MPRQRLDRAETIVKADSASTASPQPELANDEAYVSIRQHTSAYASASSRARAADEVAEAGSKQVVAVGEAYVSIRLHTSVYVCIRLHTRQHCQRLRRQVISK